MRFIPNQYFCFAQQIRRLSTRVELAPNEWLQQKHISLPHESRRAGLSIASISRPSKREQYVLNPDIQKYTAHSLKWMDITFDKRRRERIPIDSTFLALLPSSFFDYVTQHIVRPIEVIFNALHAPSYEELNFTLVEKRFGETSVVELVLNGGDWKTKLSIFILDSLNLDSAETWIELLKPKGSILLADSFGAFYLDKAAEKTCLISLEQPLHYFIASFIYMELPEYYLEVEIERTKPTYGAPNNHDKPIFTDDEMVTLCHSHADFDRYYLSRDTRAVKQFLRWKKSMKNLPVPPFSGYSIRVAEEELWCAPFEPRYDLESLPVETLEHIAINQRETYPTFSDFLTSTRGVNLTFHLDKEFSHPGGLNYARTFLCSAHKLNSAFDGVAMPEKFVVKIFDDRAGHVPELHEAGGSPLWWSQGFVTAREMLSNERNTYLRLRHVWGSTIPWFYGAFTFEMPDGLKLPGILLEYIEKDPISIKNQPEDAQIEIIKSARHAIRVLQYADITQTDWNSEQILIAKSVSSTSAPSLCCVLIDFSLCYHGTCWEDVYMMDDYGQMADVLMINEHVSNSDGVSLDLLLKWYEPREKWDTWRTSVAMDFKRPHRPPRSSEDYYY